MGDGLLQEEVAARFCRGDGNIQVQGGGVGDEDGIWLVRQGGRQVSLDRVAGQFVIRQGGAVGAVEQDICFAQRHQVAEVAPADGAESGDEEFHSGW